MDLSSIPIGVTVDSGGNVLVAEAGSDTITKCVIGMQSVLYTTTLTTPPLNNPVGIWSDTNGNLYIANPGGNDIAMVSTESINFGLHYVLPKGTNAGTSIGLDFVVPAAGVSIPRSCAIRPSALMLLVLPWSVPMPRVV